MMTNAEAEDLSLRNDCREDVSRMREIEERIARQWEQIADTYAELIGGQGTPHHREILNPCIERMLGDVNGRRLLDAGCGEGYLSRYYARKGAVVTGVDVSERLIAIARRLANIEGLDKIEFLCDDICRLESIADDWFDVVLCNLVLLNVPCLASAFRQFNRVLRRGGQLVFSIVHPAFNVYGPCRWEMGEKDPVTGRRRGLYFVADNYFDEREYQRYWKTINGEDFPGPISFFHRTLTSYLNNLISAGLIVEAIEEPRPMSQDDFFERERRIPFFLVVRASKSDSAHQETHTHRGVATNE